MSVVDFECQLTRSQISRYMGGEILSEGLLRELTAHVAECSGCRVFLEERRTALRSMLVTETAETPTHAVIHPAPKHRPAEPIKFDANCPAPTPAEKLLSQIRSRYVERNPQPEASAEPKKSLLPKTFSKPAIYSIGLAAVLIVMSYLVKSPNGLLGPKASTLFSSSSKTTADSGTSKSTADSSSKKIVAAASNSNTSTGGTSKVVVPPVAQSKTNATQANATKPNSTQSASNASTANPNHVVESTSAAGNRLSSHTSSSPTPQAVGHKPAAPLSTPHHPVTKPSLRSAHRVASQAGHSKLGSHRRARTHGVRRHSSSRTSESITVYPTQS